jgi:hypothetical protein
VKRTASFTLVFALAVSVAMVGGGTAPCSRSGTGFSASLTVRETAGIPRSGEPVTAGIPVARSAAIMSTEGLSLLDARGRAVPAQFKVTSRWGGAPGNTALPARWLLLDFEADVAARGSAAYTVRDGGAGASPADMSVLRDDADRLEISTGAARFVFNKKKFNLLDSVKVGGAEVLKAGARTGVVATDSSGRQFTSGSRPPESVSLETDGPVRKTVLMRGSLSGTGGELLDCVARVSVFAGRSDAKVQLTLRNPRAPALSEGQPQFHDIGCAGSASFENLDLVIECASWNSYRLGGVSGGDVTSAGSLSVYQDSSGGPSWDRYKGKHPRPQSYVSFRGYRVYKDSSAVASGNRPAPWLAGLGAGGGLTVAVRDFWQNYPKALRGTGGRIEVSLFPREYAGPYSLRPGEQKTHEVSLCFSGAGGRAAASARAGASQYPLLAAIPPDYSLSTGALGRVAGLTGDAEFDAYEALNMSTIGGSGTNLFKVIEDAEFYSWQDYGEQPVDFENGGTGSFNQKYNFDLGMLLQYSRTGDERWYRLADAAGRHTADLDIYHHQGAPGAWWDGGFFGHSYHDEEDNSNPNRNYGGPHPDLVFAAPGLFLRYAMTGDMVAFEAAREVADNVRYRFDNSFGRGNGEGYAEAIDYDNECYSARPFANGLWVLVESFRATGDEGYLRTAEWLITNSHKATDMFLTQPVAGDRRFTKLFVWDLLVNSLGKYLDLLSEMGRADPCGARDLLVAMTRQEANMMFKQDAAGNKGVPYAWMRDGTPWGWEDSEVAVNVCNWQLLTADSMTYGFLHTGDAGMLERAREAFRTGSSPNVEYYEPVYTATKEATSSANFGLAYLSYRHPPGGPATEAQFEEWLCVQNTESLEARVKVEYFTGDGTPRVQGLVVPASSRRTISVNAAIGQGKDVSARVTSDRPVTVERPMYFNYHGWCQGGSVSAGASAASRRWYFAEGCTRDGFEEWITVENAGAAAGAVTLTYMMEGGRVAMQKVDAGAGSRTTVNVNAFVGAGQDVSVLVESAVPVVVERPVYFRYRGKWSGGHVTAGATAPSKTWYFGEGTTRSNSADGSFEEWLCLQNPVAAPARARVSFMLDGGGTVEREYDLAARSRRTVDVGLEVGPDRDVSMVVTSDVPLVAERPMYFRSREGFDGGDVALGVPSPGTERSFAEGCTREGFQTWLSIGNPQAKPALARVEYFMASGRRLSREVTVPARGRSTVDVNLDVGPGQDVGCRVSSPSPLVVERPMYFNYHGRWSGGHTGSGSARPGLEWNFAEGCTR